MSTSLVAILSVVIRRIINSKSQSSPAQRQSINKMSLAELGSSCASDRVMSTSKSGSLLRLNQEAAKDWHQDHETDDSEISENDFLTKGAFLLTPSHELSIEKAATICEKMNFR